MKTLEEYLAQREHEGNPVEKNDEFKLRYETDTIEALEKCSSRYNEREKPYRTALRTDIATVYAHALRLENDPNELDRFYRGDYWSGLIKPSKIKSVRDLFRDVCKHFVKVQYRDSNGDGKAASKYSAVMAAMHADDVFPEDVPEMIVSYGGIERISRQGLEKPPYIDPRDVGDGMTGTGEVIVYPDEEEKKRAKRERISITGDEMIHKLYDELQHAEGFFDVRATADVSARGTDLVVYKVEKEASDITDPVALLSEDKDGLVMVPVYMTASRLRRISRMVERRPVQLQLEKIEGFEGGAFRALAATYPLKPSSPE